MAKFDMSYEVCECNKVTLAEIVYAIENKDIKDLKTLGEITDAGTTCHRCRCENDDFSEPKMQLYLEQILKKLTS